MRRALVKVQFVPAGILTEVSDQAYSLEYLEGYSGPPISLTLPVRSEPYQFVGFPPFFDGLLPEGVMLDALLRKAKLDRHDLFGQLIAVGRDMVGAVTVELIEEAS